jgi:hypothetical protein
MFDVTGARPSIEPAGDLVFRRVWPRAVEIVQESGAIADVDDLAVQGVLDPEANAPECIAKMTSIDKRNIRND